MADITVDSSVTPFTVEDSNGRCLVWTSKTKGYFFFIDSASDLHYRVTTDSGATWGTEATIRTGTLEVFSIWFDKWTKDDTGTQIHIVYVDADDDNITYNSLDTSDDSLGGDVISFNGASADLGGWLVNCVSIVKSRGGIVYIGGWIDNDGENDFAKATMSGGVATSFTSKAGVNDANGVDRIMFLPGNDADDDDIWCVYQDASANSLTLKVYDQSANTWSESNSIESITENTGFFGFDCMQRHSDGHVILINWNNHIQSAADLACFDITNITTWSQKTDVITNDSTYSSCLALMINQQNDDLYVAFSTATTSGSIQYKKSTDGGGAWGSATALSVTSDDHRLICSGGSVGNAGGRWQPIWFNDDLNDMVTNKDNSVEIDAGTSGTNMQLNIGDSWKTISGMQINIGDSWKTVAGAQINIGDSWKTIF